MHLPDEKGASMYVVKFVMVDWLALQKVVQKVVKILV